MMFDKIKKAMGIEKKKAVRSPTLDTVIMVENFIKGNSGRYKKTEVFKKLPRKVMWGTFQTVMEHLEGGFKIVYNKKGFIIHTWKPELHEKIRESTELAKGVNSLEEIKEKITPILKSFGVKKAGIFGSFARGEEGPFSDVDILVEMGENGDYLGLLVFLKEKLGRKVDLVEYSQIRSEIRNNILNDEVLLKL